MYIYREREREIHIPPLPRNTFGFGSPVLVGEGDQRAPAADAVHAAALYYVIIHITTNLYNTNNEL